MRFVTRARSNEPRGQVVVIVALAMVIMVAMVGLVVDGGYAWGRQRQTQNASDAASEAGAVVLAQNIAGVQPAKTDADVDAAVTAVLDSNGTARKAAYYTDVSGNLLTPAGVATTNADEAALVGGGAIPPGGAGVETIGLQTFDTFLARVIGVNQFTATTPATAVAGYLTQICSAAAGCDVIPVTFPVTLLTCTNTGQDPQPVQPPSFWQIGNDPIVIPLCGNGAGNVGWIDWYPDQTYCGNGAAEVVCEINDPNNPAIDLPSWQYVAQTGNISSSQVENALNNKYAGKIAQIPQFDGTCNTQPSGVTLSDCPEANVGGQGQNQWYHLPQFAAFQFCGPTIPACTAKGFTKGAYVNGNNPICETIDYGVPGTGQCLVGRFVRFISKGTVGPGTGSSSGTDAIGVQLIR
jgi:Flp pilus assembly protein TadG